MTRPCTLLLLLGLFALGCPSSADDDDATGSDVDDDDDAADVDGDGSPATEDCDDNNPLVFPGADELCNDVDDDCDGVVDEDPVDGNVYYADDDGDGFYGGEVIACALPPGHGFASNDCDDTNADVHPGADELCNGADEDCDGVAAADEVDSDADGYLACAECNDADPLISPDALELCDGVDNNCDGAIDEEGNFFPDGDSDGYGDSSATPQVASCSAPPEGLVADGSDCDDGDGAINQAATEVCDAADVDEDCDGAADDADSSVDSSGFAAWYPDDDGDGFGDPNAPADACDQPGGHITDSTDCDDGAATVFPGAASAEPTLCTVDADGDGWGDEAASPPLDAGSDCDDGAAVANPGISTETCGDGLDNDCDGLPLGCGPSGPLSLTAADSKLIAEATGYSAGNSVAGAGDVNNDGVDDLLIGAPGADSGGPVSGAAYLVLGPVTGDLDLANADAKFIGEAASNQAGWSVAGAGDVNNDGFDDLIIGAPLDDSGGSDSGAAYLVLGPVTGDMNLANADAKLIGEDPDDNAGRSVAGAGDVNNDGFDDLLIGANGEDSGTSNAGAAYLVLGPVTGDVDLANADAKFVGEASGDRAGRSVAGAGDVNNDGFDDLIIGANGSNSGAAYLVLGPVTGYLDLANADARFIGEASGDRAGRSVAGAGDVNNDGFDDLLIGAPHEDSGGNGSGAAYLVLGPVAGDLDLANADAKLIGEAAGDDAGISVAGAGDVNNDGFDDLLVGAEEHDSGGSNSGAAYLVLGPVTGDLDLANADAKLIGEASGDWAGVSVTGAGDVNGDGVDDICVGANNEDSGGSSAGAAYLVHGGLGF